jgi:predicted porin
MQKKLIALAVASLASGAAFAQTNVTIYGIVDAGYVYSWGDPGRVAGTRFDKAVANIRGTNTFSGVASPAFSAGSRLGFQVVRKHSATA